MEEILEQTRALLNGRILFLEEEESRLPKWRLIKWLKINAELIRLLRKIDVIYSLIIININERYYGR